MNLGMETSSWMVCPGAIPFLNLSGDSLKGNHQLDVFFSRLDVYPPGIRLQSLHLSQQSQVGAQPFLASGLGARLHLQVVTWAGWGGLVGFGGVWGESFGGGLWVWVGGGEAPKSFREVLYGSAKH